MPSAPAPTLLGLPTMKPDHKRTELLVCVFDGWVVPMA